ncbi:hypothetical protein SAMN06265222_101431 [Neorhodopirellula lusitana]|uniref:Uncharacterized protein n=1 Tax=Neorhodopirellula lusitana TaxID=445327 RepID=A0ABY1PS95_9BACT|nr:hypothetical protein SAMN06265222_101431 [Neorhodopirellula lusitana]
MGSPVILDDSTKDSRDFSREFFRRCIARAARWARPTVRCPLGLATLSFDSPQSHLAALQAYAWVRIAEVTESLTVWGGQPEFSKFTGFDFAGSTFPTLRGDANANNVDYSICRSLARLVDVALPHANRPTSIVIAKPPFSQH